MYKSKVISTVFLLCIAVYGLGQTTQDIVYSKKETLYSTKTGKAIGDVLLSIAPKNATPSNNEWLLIVGNQGGNFVDARNETTLWVFNRKTNANQLKRDLKNQDYTLEVKGFNEFMPFCENGIRFTLKDWDELRKQTQLSFFINASAGENITLRLVFYTATADRRRTTIDDEAKVKIDFKMPDLSSYSNQTRQSGGGGGGAQGEVISLTEKIDPAARLEAQQEELISQAEEANREQRIALLNSFISERNLEISLFQGEINALLEDKKTKINELTLDSLSTIANEMKNRVDYWENGYSDILLTEETIHDKFSKFRIAHALTVKKIEDLRRQQNPLNLIIDFVKDNLLLSLGGGIGGFIFIKFFMKFFKKMMSKMKSKINQSIGKAKTNAKKQLTEKPKRWTFRKKKKKETDDEFENIDINDLAEI